MALRLLARCPPRSRLSSAAAPQTIHASHGCFLSNPVIAKDLLLPSRSGGLKEGCTGNQTIRHLFLIKSACAMFESPIATANERTPYHHERPSNDKSHPT